MFAPNSAVRAPATGSRSARPAPGAYGKSASTIRLLQHAGRQRPVASRWSTRSGGERICSWIVGLVRADAAGAPQVHLLNEDESAATYTLRKDWISGESQVKATAKVMPTYPPIAQAAHAQGVVTIEITVGPAGEVSGVLVKGGPEMLRGSALDAVRQWRFAPLLMGPQPTVFERM